ncbi:hypothetical protein [Streptomyces rhizosphaericus]|uniref:hypothetical protein n=1 Tax=Streptomyces rhizosphaericus TaxID=114699 RepID=UPI00142E6469|nr:hypothetical protein [Streptomyces rhizosphaericus]
MNRSMRGALAAAVHALLKDVRLVGCLDVVRLAAVVLLAKAPATSPAVRVLYRDLAGWLGCSVSYVGHTVVPKLIEAGVVTREPDRDARGRVTAVVLDLLPLREARAAGGMHPLALLTQRDLATLLRVCEAVTCPGWAPRGGPETSAGFMAGRRGRDAATDRLAMVLLVLTARRDGRVRMAPGRVVEGFGRGDATVARLLGCPVGEAAPVVDRLVRLDVLRFEAGGRDRLVVPAVTEAYARLRRAISPMASTVEPAAEDVESPAADTSACPRCCGGTPARGEDHELVLAGDGWAQQSLDDALTDQAESAFRDQDPSSGSSSQVSGVFEGDPADVKGAGLHPAHAPVVDLCVSSAADRDCFSGSAVSGCDGHRESAHAGEDHSHQSSSGEGALASAQGPLRGEKQELSPSSKVRRAPAAAFGAVVVVPEDLREALEPLRTLWSGLGRVSTSKWLAQPVRTELARLRGLVGEESAEQALAGRLRRRLHRSGGRPVNDLVGWLLHFGLPQRPGCWSHLCDDGTRMDTGGPCESCDCLIGDRRGLRRVVAAEVAVRYPHMSPEERRPLYERELRTRYERQMAEDAVRREQAAREREMRDRAVARQRDRLAQRDAQRAAAPCRECALPDAGGRCLPCTLADGTRQLVVQAVEVVLALRADLGDSQAVEELAGRVERDTWAIVRKVDNVDDSNGPGARAYAEYDRARRLVGQRRSRALAALAASEAAESEARHVQWMALRNVWPVTADARQKAEDAAGRARERVASELLMHGILEVQRARAVEPLVPVARRWSQRLAQFLDEQRERVSAS